MQPTEATRRLTVDAKGVALLLGLEFEHQFLTRRARLEKRGFPRPLPMTPLRWPIVAIEDWVRDSGRARQPRQAVAAVDAPQRNALVLAFENGARFSDGRAA